MNKEKRNSLIGWIIGLSFIIFVLFQFCACDAHEPLPDEQVGPWRFAEYQGALHPYCADSGFMLSADDVLADYNSPSLEAVYSVDSIDLDNGKVRITPIYHTDPNLPVCVPYYFQSYDSFYGANQFFEIKCKEMYAQWVLDIDTCQ